MLHKRSVPRLLAEGADFGELNSLFLMKKTPQQKERSQRNGHLDKQKLLRWLVYHNFVWPQAVIPPMSGCVG